MLATQLASAPDPVDYYLLGNADVQASYYNDAVAAYEKCAASGPLVTQCKSRGESAKKMPRRKWAGSIVCRSQWASLRSWSRSSDMNP